MNALLFDRMRIIRFPANNSAASISKSACFAMFAKLAPALLFGGKRIRSLKKFATYLFAALLADSKAYAILE